MNRIPKTQQLFDHLLSPEANQLEVVGEELPRFFQQWTGAAAPLLPLLPRYYEVARVGPAEFTTKEEKRLNAIDEATDAFAAEIKDLKRAFNLAAVDSLAEPLFQTHYGAVEFFPGKSRFLRAGSRELRAFGRMLKRLGDAYSGDALADEGERVSPASVPAKRALTYYSTAFFLDYGNTDALVAAISVLDQHRTALDMDNRRTRALSEHLFDVKSELYNSTSNTRKDWSNIYSCHVVLGDLYAKQDLLGRTKDLHSAIGQWERALAVEQLLRTGRSELLHVGLPEKEVDPRFPESPMLRVNLVSAYLKKKETNEALRLYTETVRRYLDSGQLAQANKVVTGLREEIAGLPNNEAFLQVSQLLDVGSVRSIVEKAILAHGGRENLTRQRASTTKIKGTLFQMDMKLDYSMDVWTQLPDKLKYVVDLEVMGMKAQSKSVINGDKGWVTLPGDDASRELDSERMAEAKEDMYHRLLQTLVPLTSNDFRLSPLGESNINGRTAVGVRVSSKARRDVSLFFDKETFILLKTEARVKDLMGQEVLQETFYRDYKDSAGVRFPSKTVIKRDGKVYIEMEATEFKFHQRLDESTFAKP